MYRRGIYFAVVDALACCGILPVLTHWVWHFLSLAAAMYQILHTVFTLLCVTVLLCHMENTFGGISSPYNCTLVVNSSNSSSPSSAREDCRCPPERDTVCTNLTTALLAVRNSTQVIIQGSRNHTLSLSPEFHSLHDVSLLGVNGSGQALVRVTCERGVGLSFVYSQRISVEGLEFYYCGALHNSTSRDLSVHNANTVRFLRFKTSLYFEFCRDVSFSSVKISNSDGIGLTMYSTVGENVFKHCGFSNNSAVDREVKMGGGGMYIEFPYCPPDRPEDCMWGSQTIPKSFRSDAHYSIRDCCFEDNVASATHTYPAEHHLVRSSSQHVNHMSLGHGGGLCIYICSADNVSVSIEKSNVSRNKAVWGGGILARFLNDSRHSSFTMKSTKVEHNEASFSRDDFTSSSAGGGGVSAGFFHFTNSDSNHNHVGFYSTRFAYNKAYWGGGLSFFAAKEEDRRLSTNMLEFYKCEWAHNSGQIGSAIDLSVYFFPRHGAILSANFTDCNFHDNHDMDYGLNHPIGEGTLYSDNIAIMFNRSVTFDSNKRCAITAVEAMLMFLNNCTATFTNNSGKDGGAIKLLGASKIRVHENTSMSFVNNTATRRSGAIDATPFGEQSLYGLGDCFIQNYNKSILPFNWTATFYFENNTESFTMEWEREQSIGSESILPCQWAILNSTFYDGSTYEDPRKESFCWNSNWEYKNGNCTSNTITAPATFSNSHLYNRSYIVESFPGELKEMGVKVIDDKGTDTTAQLILTAHIYDDNFKINMHHIADNSIMVFGKPSTMVSISLTTLPPRSISTVINVSLLECPYGFISTNDSRNRTNCTCDGSYGGSVRCLSPIFQSKLRGDAWIGRYQGKVVLGYTPAMRRTVWTTLEQTQTAVDTQLCGPLNRTETLCGKCLPGFRIQSINIANNFSCVNCTHGIQLYLHFFHQFGLATLFFIIIWLLSLVNIGATTGVLNSFVFFAQVINAGFGLGTIQYESIEVYTTLRELYLIPYGVWSLIFIRSKSCMSEDFNVLFVFSLKYLDAVYPFVFLCVLYVGSWLISKVVTQSRSHIVHKWTEPLRRSLIDVFSTYLVVSYVTYSINSQHLIAPATLYNSAGKAEKQVLYYNGTIEFLGSEHLPYFITAMSVLVFIVVPIPLLLFVYPSWISECPSITCNRESRAMHITPVRFQNISRIFKPKKPVMIQGRETCMVEMNSLPSGNVNFMELEARKSKETEGFFKLLFESFQKCYKDGSQPGWRDCRYFAGIYFILRVLFFHSLNFDVLQQLVFQQVLCIGSLLMVVYIRPYRSAFYNNIDAAMFTILAGINTINIFNLYLTFVDRNLSASVFAMQYTLIVLPLFCISGYIFYILVLKRKRIIKIAKSSYNLLQRLFCCCCLRWHVRIGAATPDTEDSIFVDFMRETHQRQHQNRQSFRELSNSERDSDDEQARYTLMEDDEAGAESLECRSPVPHLAEQIPMTEIYIPTSPNT